jgi:hypothetical protein
MTWNEWAEVFKVLFIGVIAFSVVHIADRLDRWNTGDDE